MVKHLKGFRGGSAPNPANEATNSTSVQNPWAPVQPYLYDLMQRGMQTYAQGPAKYAPFNTVANLTPYQLQAMQGIRDYTNSNGTQGSMQNASTNIQSLLRGDPNQLQQMGADGLGAASGLMASNMYDPAAATNQLAFGNNTNPYLAGNVNNVLQGMSNNFQMNTLQDLRHNAIGDGSYGSSRNEMQEGQAAGALSKDMRDTAAQMYGNDYNNQQNLALGALGQSANTQLGKAGMALDMFNNGASQNLAGQGIGLNNYTNVLNMPFNMFDAQNKVGQIQQNQDQNVLNESTARWNWNQNSGWDSFGKLAGMFGPLMGFGGAGSGQSYKTEAAPYTSAANNAVAGGLTAAGLAAKLYANKSAGSTNATG